MFMALPVPMMLTALAKAKIILSSETILSKMIIFFIFLLLFFGMIIKCILNPILIIYLV